VRKLRRIARFAVDVILIGVIRKSIWRRLCIFAGPMVKNKIKETTVGIEGEIEDESPPPPYNTKLDPDNATSPLPFEERLEEGREHFFPEGGPEDPPVRDFEKEYDFPVEPRS
jgi:hypothetical protein